MSKTLIIGATGTVGQEVARLLAAAGHQVVGTTRRPAAQPASPDLTWVGLDLATGEGLDAAFEGVERVFLLSPPGYADQYAVMKPAIDAAARHGVKKAVLMTAKGVELAGDIPFRRVELALEASGVPYAIVRPSWFSQNFHTFWIQGIRERDVIALPAGDSRTAFIDARDIAAVVALLLRRDGTDGDVGLTGPEALTHDEVAAKLSAVAGRTLRYEDADPAAFEAGLVAAGLPADYAALMGGLYAGVREGWAAEVNGEVERLLGRGPIGFDQYARDFADQFTKVPASV